MSTSDLTGRTRHRLAIIHRSFAPDEHIMVLQVEYRNDDFDHSPSPTLWRDARPEDLTTKEATP